MLNPESESEINSISETELVAEINPYEYIDIINADYESCYNTSKHNACIVNDIAYFNATAPNADNKKHRSFYSYNISTGEAKCIVHYEKDMNSICYASGIIYALVDKEIRCYDLDGNILKTFNNTAELYWDNDFEIQAVMADGSCVVGYNRYKFHYLISANFTSAKQIAETTDGVHGTTEDIPCAYINGGRGNTLYVAESRSKKIFYEIDVTTNETTEYTIPENAPGMGSSVWQ